MLLLPLRLPLRLWLLPLPLRLRRRPLPQRRERRDVSSAVTSASSISASSLGAGARAAVPAVPTVRRHLLLKKRKEKKMG